MRIFDIVFLLQVKKLFVHLANLSLCCSLSESPVFNISGWFFLVALVSFSSSISFFWILVSNKLLWICWCSWVTSILCHLEPFSAKPFKDFYFECSGISSPIGSKAALGNWHLSVWEFVSHPTSLSPPYTLLFS